MHKAIIVVLSLCWIAVFSALTAIGMSAAVDGVSVARDAMPVAVPLLGISPLATPALMGGLALGAAVVTALFCWMLLTALLVDENPSRGIDNPVELAHGGALGIAGIIFFTTFLDATPLVIVSSALLLASLVVSLMLSRAAPEAAPTYAPRHVRDRAIEAARLYSMQPAPMRTNDNGGAFGSANSIAPVAARMSAEIVPFPARGDYAGRGVH